MVDDAAGERRLLEQPIQDGRGVGGGVGAHAGVPDGMNRTHVRNGRQSSATVPRSCDRLPVTAARLTRSATGSYARAGCCDGSAPRRLTTPPTEPADSTRRRRPARTPPPRRRPVGEPGLAALPIAGFTRRRAAAVVSGILAAWIVIVFVRQVGEASAATARADDIASAQRAASQAQVASLERELELIGRQRYIEQQARGYGLGSPREIAVHAGGRCARRCRTDAPGLRSRSRVGRATPTDVVAAGALADRAVRPVATDRRSIRPPSTRTRAFGSLSLGPGADAPAQGRADGAAMFEIPVEDFIFVVCALVGGGLLLITVLVDDILGGCSMASTSTSAASRSCRCCSRSSRCSGSGGLFATQVLDVHGGAGGASSGTAFGLVGAGHRLRPVQRPAAGRGARAVLDRATSSATMRSSQVGIPAGHYGSVLVKAEGQTHEFSATSTDDIPAGTRR